MKISLTKPISVEVIGRYEEVYNKSFSRGWIADVSKIDNHGTFSVITLCNEEILLDVPQNSYTIIK